MLALMAINVANVTPAMVAFMACPPTNPTPTAPSTIAIADKLRCPGADGGGIHATRSIGNHILRPGRHNSQSGDSRECQRSIPTLMTEFNPFCKFLQGKFLPSSKLGITGWQKHEQRGSCIAEINAREKRICGLRLLSSFAPVSRAFFKKCCM